MNPYESDFHAWMADSEQALSHHKASEEHHLKALELEPNIPVNLENLAIVWLNDGKYDNSLEMWIKLNHLEPDHTQHWYNIAKCYYHLQVYDRSRFWAKKFKEAENGPKKEDNLVLLGQIEAKDKKFAESLHYYLELLSVKENMSGEDVIESWVQGIKDHGSGWSEKCISVIHDIIHGVIAENNPVKVKNLIDVCKQVNANAQLRLLGEYVQYEQSSTNPRSPSQKKRSSSKKKNN